MGGGSWNGKNYGGLHTGADKKQNVGPYSSDGYRPNPFLSNLDFVTGDEVIYIGSNKFKHKTRVPNGTKGTLLSKNNLKDKKLKSSRSIHLVDFGEYGKRYVRKELLQFTSDYSESLEHQMDLLELKSSLQDYRNEYKKSVKQQLREEKYQQTLKNREENKRFREWRITFLDSLRDNLEADLCKNKNDETVKDNRVKEVEIKKEVRVLKQLENPSDEDTAKLNEYKKQLEDIRKYEKRMIRERGELERIIKNHRSRKFVRNVYSRSSYNDYLHCVKNNDDYTTFYHKSKQPSREYVVDPSVEATTNAKLEAVHWGV